MSCFKMFCCSYIQGDIQNYNENKMHGFKVSINPFKCMDFETLCMECIVNIVIFS